MTGKFIMIGLAIWVFLTPYTVGASPDGQSEGGGLFQLIVKPGERLYAKDSNELIGWQIGSLKIVPLTIGLEVFGLYMNGSPVNFKVAQDGVLEVQLPRESTSNYLIEIRYLLGGKSVIESIEADEFEFIPLCSPNKDCVPVQVKRRKLRQPSNKEDFVSTNYKPILAKAGKSFYIFSFSTKKSELQDKLIENIYANRFSSFSEYPAPLIFNETLHGREAYPFLASDQSIYITSHILGNDLNNSKGYAYSNVYMSRDNGTSWKVKPIDFGISTSTTRNFIELSDGAQLLGVSDSSGNSYTYKLDAGGELPDEIRSFKFNGFPENYPERPFEEGVFYKILGKYYVILRVNNKYYPAKNGVCSNLNDQSDRLVEYEINVKTLEANFVGDVTPCGVMYPHIEKLSATQSIFTYTVRVNDALNTPLGVRAVVVSNDRPISKQNVITLPTYVIDANTPKGIASGGGYGNTILFNGKLITSYSYRDSDLKTYSEYVIWDIPDLPDQNTSSKACQGGKCSK